MPSLNDPLSRIRLLWHFTDHRNGQSIRKLGGLWSRAELARKPAEFRPGGNQWSFDADEITGMDRYVHLCLRRNHPMEFLARQDGRIERTDWIRVDKAIFQIEGVLYSHGVSNQSGMKIVPIQDALDLIDFEMVCGSPDPRDPEVKARLDRAERCEVLVPDHVPLRYLSWLPTQWLKGPYSSQRRTPPD